MAQTQMNLGSWNHLRFSHLYLRGQQPLSLLRKLYPDFFVFFWTHLTHRNDWRHATRRCLSLAFALTGMVTEGWRKEEHSKHLDRFQEPWTCGEQRFCSMKSWVGRLVKTYIACTFRYMHIQEYCISMCIYKILGANWVRITYRNQFRRVPSSHIK